MWGQWALERLSLSRRILKAHPKDLISLFLLVFFYLLVLYVLLVGKAPWAPDASRAVLCFNTITEITPLK
jgi:hypothetical protein